VCLTVNDGTVGSDPARTLAVAYDPSAGFVTGSGWINSPAGAYVSDPTLTGRATFRARIVPNVGRRWLAAALV
jgi:hypothetical protein